MTQLLDRPDRALDTGDRDRTAPIPTTGRARRRESRTWPAFFAALALYLVAGYRLAIVHHAIVGDAMARVANASYVLSSRDPHLAAIGFVWNPLPSIAALPILPFARWWPALRTQGFAGNLVSAVFMAGAVAVVWRILRDLRLAPWVAGALTVLFAIHPMIVDYGGNGDSEATLVFFLSLTCLGLLRWLDRRDLSSLLLLGAALGFGYLARQEFLAAGAATLLLVVVMTFRAEPGTGRHRRWAALTEATLAGLPFAFAVVCWAGAATIIVGTATSYLEVNADQVRAGSAGIASVVGGTTPVDRIAYFLGQVLWLEPAWSVLLLLAAVVAWRRRDARFFAPVCTFGAVLVAQGTLFAAGSTFGWLRFSITVVPLTTVVAGLLLAPRRAGAPAGRPRSSRARRWPHGATVGVVLIAGIVTLPVAVHGMTTPRFGREEAASVSYLPGYAWARHGAGAYPAHWLDGYDALARFFDRRHLPAGTVLTDVQNTFPLLLKTRHPTQFVIPSDHDFERDVADPSTFHVRYLLVSDGFGDVLRKAYPAVGTGRSERITVGPLVRRFTAGGQRLVLYRVARSVTDGPG